MSHLAQMSQHKLAPQANLKTRFEALVAKYNFGSNPTNVSELITGLSSIPQQGSEAVPLQVLKFLIEKSAPFLRSCPGASEMTSRLLIVSREFYSQYWADPQVGGGLWDEIQKLKKQKQARGA